MKAAWEMAFEKIAELVRTADVVGLIEGGAPNDEYDMEASKIFVKLQKRELNEGNAYGEIRNIFSSSFGDDTYLHEERLCALARNVFR